MFSRPFLVLALAALAAVAPAPAMPAQSALDPNEGVRLTPDPSVVNGQTVSWWGKAGRTYFIQQSDDLSLWNYLPVIEPGADQPTQWGFTSTAPRSFLRLRLSDVPTDDPFNADFDFDGVSNWDELAQGTDPLAALLDPANGLPLDWEKFYHVPPGTDPNAPAPRGDGLTYRQSFQGRFNPNDIYNGITPILAIVDGNNQTAAPDRFVSRPLVLLLTDAATGQILTNLPVSFTVGPGGGQVQRSSLGAPATALTVMTGSNGQARVFFKLPAPANRPSQITATAGSGSHAAQVTFMESSNGGVGGDASPSPFAPANVVATANRDGSADVAWTNNTDPADTEPIVLQYQDRNGRWVTLATVPAGTTSYHVPAP